MGRDCWSNIIIRNGGNYIFLGIRITDWIQAVVAVISLITSTIAVVISVKSLRLTQKSILDANRPYVTMYIDSVDTIYFSKDLVIKNFGKSSARIDRIEFDTELDQLNKEKKMQSLIGGMIAPNQKFTTTLENDFKKSVTADIEYSDLNGKKYKESIVIKTDIGKDLLWSSKRNSKDSTEATAIKHSAHAIIRAFK